MFQGLLKRAERSIDSAVSKLVGRAAVAVPLLVAAGFATAAVAIKLIELYGAVVGNALMAVIFGLLGLATMAVVSSDRSSNETASDQQETAAESSEENEDEAAPALDLPPEVISMLTSAAPMALPSVARGIGRNLPLIFVLALIVFIISRFADTGSSDGAVAESDQAAVPPAA